MNEAPPENKIAKAVDILRLGTWSLFTLFVAALLSVTVVGPFLLGHLPVVEDESILFGALLFALFGGTGGLVVAEMFVR